MLHRSITRGFAICAATATLAITTAASAQVDQQRHIDGESIYEFKDDGLLAAGLGPMGAVLKIRVGAARVQLLRPRTHFVPEMLSSVEHI